MPSIISVAGVSKVYATGFRALDRIDLEIRQGEIFALLGPNGAGKTTLIGLICGIVKLGEGRVTVAGMDIGTDYRAVRGIIGLVPQELTTDAFESVWATVSFSRGLFGKPPDPAYIEKTLRALSLWDKKDNKLRELSGGMKRRVMIAKALSHEPTVLFLDEPTAGVDVALRKDMWAMVRQLRESGVTIVLTTHYIEEAEALADRVVVMAKGLRVAEGTVRDIRDLVVRKRIDCATALDLAAVEAWPGIIAAVREGSRISITATDAEGVVRRLLDGDPALTDLEVRRAGLSEAFTELTQEAAE